MFIAKYKGECVACDKPIRVGDPCIYAADVPVHIDCDSIAPERRAEVCNSCWLEKPCDCDV